MIPSPSPSAQALAPAAGDPGFTQVEPAFAVEPQPAEGGPPPQMSNFSGSKTAKFISIDASNFEGSEQESIKAEGAEDASVAEAGGETKADAPTETKIDVDDANESKPSTESRAPSAPPTQPESRSTPTPASQPVAPSQQSTTTTSPFPGNLPIDVCFEASKLPLDVAIFNSARAAGGDEKIRKYLQAVLVVGGTALIPGMAHALESRCVPSLIAFAFIYEIFL